MQKAKSIARMDIDETVRIRMEIDPYLVLEGETPRLIDEWQEYPMDTGFFPACTFRDTVVPQKKATGLWDNLLGVEIVLYGNTPAEVRKMVADVIKAIGTQQPKSLWMRILEASIKTGEYSFLSWSSTYIF